MKLTIFAAVLVLSAGSVVACSLEIYSLERNVAETPWIVAGSVDSLDQEILFEDPESGFVQRSVSRAVLQVDQVLKGDLAPGPLELHFDPEIGLTSCGDLLDPYVVGARLVLLIDHRDADGQFSGPLLPSRVLRVGDDYESRPLYRYLQALLRGGSSALEVEFRGPQSVALGEPLPVEVVVSNRLDVPVAVRFDWPPAREPLVATVSFHLSQQDRSTFERLAAAGPAGVVEAGQTTVVPVELSDWYRWRDTGLYGLTSTLHLPASDESFYHDNWSDYIRVWSFEVVDDRTAAALEAWGRLKRRLPASDRP